MSRTLLFTGLGVIVLAALVIVVSHPALLARPQTAAPSDAVPVAVKEQVFTPTAPAASVAAQLPDGFAQYTNGTYHFSLAYPKELKVTEHLEQSGATTVTFEDPAGEQSFQIFLAPYANAEIDEQRFKLDEPSGVMDQPTDITIDGARATMFFGRNSIMGDTREVWFVHAGSLFEVTTYKELDAWLSQIMATWKWQ
jgi:hypothetical protein